MKVHTVFEEEVEHGKLIAEFSADSKRPLTVGLYIRRQGDYNVTRVWCPIEEVEFLATALAEFCRQVRRET